jgi:hypothetical protein
MKRFRNLTLGLVLLFALAWPGRASAQFYGGYGGYSGFGGYGGGYGGLYGGTGFYGPALAGPGYLGPTATGPGYIGPASPFAPSPRPVISPYLNFLRGGSPAANYFLGTVPQLQAQAQAGRFVLPDVGTLRQQQVTADILELLPQLPETGHMVQFQSYGPFYSSLNRGPRSTLLTPFSAVRPTRPGGPR